LPGPLINTATAEGRDPNNNVVSATSDPLSISLSANKSLMTKAEILELEGVNGKGIENAPGLQKPFNPKSNAAEHVGKDDKSNKNEKSSNGKGKKDNDD
jgi:hypothetical protein